MDSTHSESVFGELRQIVEGSGGAVAVVSGPNGPFYAGVRRAPVQTLLEAILSVMADRRVYERIVVLSARGEHLPQNTVLGTFRVGESCGGWLYHGTVPKKTATTATQQSSSSKPMLALRDFSSLFVQPDRVIFLQSDSKWLMEIETLLRQLEELVGQNDESDASVPRTLILIDEMLMRPRDPHLQAPDALNDETMLKIRKQLCAIPELVAGTKVDLVMFARSANTASNLIEGRMIQDDARQHVQAQHPGVQLDDSFFRTHRLSQSFPAVGWPSAKFLIWPRVDTHQPYGPFHITEKGDRKLYEVLRRVTVSKPRSFVRPAENPRRVLIDFWAAIDVGSLKAELEKRVVGQRHAIDRVIEGLERFSETCQDIIRARRQPPEKEAFYPPAFLFTGESGMGKTYIAEVISEFLFGDGFFEKLEMTQRPPDAELLGGDVGYIGQDIPPAFLSFCKRTGGMGLFTFDELDKVKRMQSARLSDALNPFFGVLAERQLKPKDPKNANHTDLRTYFRNMILVFTANAVESGERPGYELLSNFGGPLLGRFKDVIQFTALESKDVFAAVEFFCRKYLKRIQETLLIEDRSIEFDRALLNGLAAEYDSKTRDRHDIRNFRRLETFVEKRLPELPLKQKLRNGAHQITPAELNPQLWTP